MNLQSTITEIKEKFNLDASQLDDASNQAIDSLSGYLEGYSYEFNEDGIDILDSEDEIVEMSEGNFSSKVDFEKEVNVRYISALEQFAALV